MRDSQIIQKQSILESDLNNVYSKNGTLKETETLVFITIFKKKQLPKGWVGGDATLSANS